MRVCRICCEAAKTKHVTAIWGQVELDYSTRPAKICQNAWSLSKSRSRGNMQKHWETEFVEWSVLFSIELYRLYLAKLGPCVSQAVRKIQDMIFPLHRIHAYLLPSAWQLIVPASFAKHPNLNPNLCQPVTPEVSSSKKYPFSLHRLDLRRT